MLPLEPAPSAGLPLLFFFWSSSFFPAFATSLSFELFFSSSSSFFFFAFSFLASSFFFAAEDFSFFFAVLPLFSFLSSAFSSPSWTAHLQMQKHPMSYSLHRCRHHHRSCRFPSRSPRLSRCRSRCCCHPSAASLTSWKSLGASSCSVSSSSP